MEEKRRVGYLDMAKGVGILFVVVFHILGSLLTTDPKDFMLHVTTYIVTIALPIFFIVSGMQDYLGHIEERELGRVFIKRLKGLMVPYASFSVISILFTIITGLVSGKTFVLSDYYTAIISFVTLRGFSVYWFLPALLIGGGLFSVLVKLPKIVRRVSYVILTIFILTISDMFSMDIWESSLLYYALGSLLITLGRSILASCFIWFGYEAMGMLEYFEKKYGRCVPNNEVESDVLSNEGKIVACDFAFGFILLLLQYFLSKQVGGTNINYMIFGNSYIFYASAIIGSMGVILLLKGMDSIKLLSRNVLSSLKYMGKNSLVIMGTHMDFMVLSLAFYVGYKVANISPKAKVLVLYLTIAIVVAVIERLWIFIYNKWLGKLIGK